MDWCVSVSMLLLVSVCQASDWYAFQQYPRKLEETLRSDEVSTARFHDSGLECTQVDACTFFRDVLLVVKMNPVRLLWLDPLLTLYSSGFLNIVFFSTLQKGDTSTEKWLPVGSRNATVFLVDDNYGFCDHHTVRMAMSKWPDFAGYIYLTDDLLFEFWKVVGYDKQKVWRQRPERFERATMKLEEATKNAIRDILDSWPRLRAYIDPHKPSFAPTSGLYYVPRAHAAEFTKLSDKLLKHRTYNEWGVPTLLQLVDHGDYVSLSGKLVWGIKRHLARRYLSNPRHIWHHPVRANGELFVRILAAVRGGQHATAKLAGGWNATSLFAPCLECASYPLRHRRMKGLYHDCGVTTFERCQGSGGAAALWPQLRSASLVGGAVVVPQERRDKMSPLELEHEGFWGKDITLFVFQSYYPSFNQTYCSSNLLKSYPMCCTAR